MGSTRPKRGIKPCVDYLKRLDNEKNRHMGSTPFYKDDKAMH